MTNPTTDSEAYKAKKRFFNSLMTVYGRKTVLEAFQEPNVEIFRLHLAKSNKNAEILDDIISLAKKKSAEIVYHDRQALSRISKNAAQDQGVAADLKLSRYQTVETFLQDHDRQDFRLLALDGITNPQNLGMIIRSACAGNIDGIIIPLKGNAQIDPLVIKASAGTLFKAPILRCQSLTESLESFRQTGTSVCALSSYANNELKDFAEPKRCIYVLGNETNGVSNEVNAICNEKIKIHMNNNVESLNVAITAALIAFKGCI